MEKKKRISIVVPIYNEVSMVGEICDRVGAVFEKLPAYSYEIVFFDDGSTDGTNRAIEEMCARREDVKAVFYSRNFGYLKSTFYCMQQAKGDCAIILHADLQNPPEMIPQFIEKWEAGAQIVLGVKNKSRENRFMYFMRSVFYFLMIRLFGVPLVPHATEFELFDRSFLDILLQMKTNMPFLRGIVSQYGARTERVYYTQDARKKGRSKFNLRKYYDFALCGITQYSTAVPGKIISGAGLGLLLVAAEAIVSGIIGFPQADYLTIMNGIVLRCILAAVCVLMGVAGLILEFVIRLGRNAADQPLIVEKKRIRY